jgi:hypothetical protein
MADLRVGQAVAPFEERQLVWEQQAVLAVDGREIPYLRAAIELLNTPDRAFRLALDRARASAGARGLNGLRRDRFAAERDVVCAVAAEKDYPRAISLLSRMDLDGLAAQAEGLLRDTNDLYRDALRRLARRRLGLDPSALMRADTGWMFRADQHDAAFPPDGLVATAVRQMNDMGLDAHEAGRVRMDTDERPGKQPRAFCAPVRVPHEVYLVLRQAGGHNDYRTFWHELGHAMHFASVDADRPFHERWLGDNSVTEGFAMLWDHLTLDAGWLARYTGLGAAGGAGNSRVRDLLWELAVAELYLLRRYAGKLLYELILHRSDYGDGAATAYAERLTDATGFQYPVEDYVRDVDPGFYAARYLRAWQLEAALARALVERFDVDWFRNPRAGAFVRELMRRGQADPADQLARDVTGQGLAFTAVLGRLVPLLA